ncbi:phage major tail tube protein [Ilyobacter polytropus]|uniref:Major tail tube protein n=1 Tax=Ilyobacter polytropus (strain ATCC 51220 / DSM 2926 / LMG 16218 / CuHBu1) TaxID=572544 RepID=E3HBL5_ILYPC|nr:phage major tail tube protein [Ilyobacter polytropus]ADO83711.1 major tail tube protein [Ilyobacter polytropus DSM 2926]
MKNIPEKILQIRVLEGSSELGGIVDITPPNFENQSEEITGAGIDGSYESSSVGGYSNLPLVLKHRVVPSIASRRLMKPGAKDLTIYMAKQIYNSESGETEIQKIEIQAKATHKSLNSGTTGPNTKQDAEQTFNLLSYKETIDGEVAIEYDKFNQVCIIDGTDVLAEVRNALGLS